MHPSHYESKVITLADLWHAFLRGSPIFILAIILSVNLGIKKLKTAEYKYQASAVVVRSGGLGGGSESGSSALSTGLRLLGGGAQSGGTGAFSYVMEIATSQELIRRIDAKYGWGKKVFGEAWQTKPELGEVGMRGRLVNAVEAFFGQNPTAPSHYALAEYVKNSFAVSTVGAGGMKRLTFLHRDPEFAVEALNILIKEVDDYTKESDLFRQRKLTELYRIRAEEATNASLRNHWSNLYLSSIAQLDVLSSELPHTMEVLDPPVASDRTVEPKPMKVMGVSVAGGIGGGVFGALLWGATAGLWIRNLVRRLRHRNAPAE